MLAYLAVIVIIFAYNTNPLFRYFTYQAGIDAVLNSRSIHEYRIGIGLEKLPLPPRTSFVSKGSEMQSSYDTKTGKDEIVKFYRELSDPGTAVETWQEGDAAILSFTYNQDRFVVGISQNKKRRWKMAIDIDKSYYGYFDGIMLVRMVDKQQNIIASLFEKEYYGFAGSEFKHPNRDMTFYFDEHNMIDKIVCGEGIDVNGVTPGMSVAEIEEVLGKGEFSGHENGEQEFALNYKYKYFSFHFPISEDGCSTGATIKYRSIYSPW